MAPEQKDFKHPRYSSCSLDLSKKHSSEGVLLSPEFSDLKFLPASQTSSCFHSSGSSKLPTCLSVALVIASGFTNTMAPFICSVHNCHGTPAPHHRVICHLQPSVTFLPPGALLMVRETSNKPQTPMKFQLGNNNQSQQRSTHNG